ncbi:MAG: hypothetical protein JO299_20495 [Gammaproteobacteria bacterium]|nr:hypothetical protein [Gammaproteobacteria bacterium]
MARKPGRPSVAAAKAAAKKPPAVGPSRASSTMGSGPKISKDELRTQLEKLERANASLRAKSREANRQAKADTARIAELEDQMARLEKDAASRSESAKHEPESAAAVGMNPENRAVDPGDDLSPGTALEDSATPDDDAKTSREKLDEPLGMV